MRQIAGIAAASVMIVGLSAGAPPAARPTFRLVSVDVSSPPKVFTVLDVRTEAAEPPALAANDFQLLEDGKATSIATRTLKFRDTSMGLALVVAIDVSPSMEGRPINAIRQGLSQLVSRKRNSDRVAVLSFADDIRWETRWDVSSAAMQDTFQKLRTRGNATRLYDAVGQGLDELAAQSKQDPGFPSRMCILVLSDGHDEGSRGSLNDIVARFRGSRVRLDSVGLAHSPLWLRSLQTLANAGFGGFRTAASPEQLTQLLGQGIDALLDVPAIEFQAEKTSGDGKSHQMGTEYLPAHWRDQMTVMFPQASLTGDRRMWTAAVLVLLLILTAAGIARHRKPSAAVANISATPPPPRVVNSPPYRKTETVWETPPDSSRPASGTIARKVAEPPPLPPVTFAATPARAGTVLAPQASGAQKPRTLVAVAGPYAGQSFSLSADEFWIGSQPNNQLCLSADPAVSGNHACIRCEDRFYRLYDNGSLNNTLLNGRPIGREVVLLQAGDRIGIGQSVLTLGT